MLLYKYASNLLHPLYSFSIAFNEEDFNNYTDEIVDVPLVKNNFTIQVVVQQLPKWESLSRYLELSDTAVEEIKYNNAHNYEEQKYQCIKQWVRQNGKVATLKRLLWVIYFNLKDKSLVMNIVQTLKDTSKLFDDLFIFVSSHPHIKIFMYSYWLPL